MTEGQDPFEALGAGGFDMNALLQQAQQMQEQLQEAQQRLHDLEVEGTVGSVTVKVNGIGELTAVDVKPGGFDADDAESLSDLGDMVVAAYRDAKAKADAMATEALGPLAGGMWRLGGPRAPGAPAARGAGPARLPGLSHNLMYEGVVQDLIDELGRLPGVGPKGAQRIAF